jgi:ubiquinone/menaquinone biosynthesis C-methylase UbiE
VAGRRSSVGAIVTMTTNGRRHDRSRPVRGFVLIRALRAAYGVSDRVAPGLSPRIQKALIRFGYQAASAFAARGAMEFMNYGYAPLGGAVPDENRYDVADRYGAALYLHVAGAVSLRGKDVLEVGCGRGGGAALVARTLGPRCVVGVDFAPRAIRLCRQRYRAEGLSFRQADAEALPFPPGSFDVVINIESSHCYPNAERFFSEVARVLRPNGYFLIADLRPRVSTAILRTQLTRTGLAMLDEETITPNVVRALELDSARRRAEIASRVPALLRGPAHAFAGIQGSPIFEALQGGEAEYLRFVLQKR